MTSPHGSVTSNGQVTVVIATRNRPVELARSLSQLSSLRPVPQIIVVDNASDGPLGWLSRHPAQPVVIRLPVNRGAAARTVGAQHATTPYLAFSDDDSWWAPGALRLAAVALDRHPRLALVAGRALVGPAGRPDPVNEAMAASPLPAVGGLPGTPVLGCLACATVVRRAPFLQVGGFHELFLVGGEESLLCYDLAAAGWGVRYLPEVIAHHHPSTLRPAGWRRRATERRNAALTRWLRRPLSVAVSDSGRLVWAAGRDRVARVALAGLLRRLPTALAQRRLLPPPVERDIRRLETPPDG